MALIGGIFALWITGIPFEAPRRQSAWSRCSAFRPWDGHQFVKPTIQPADRRRCRSPDDRGRSAGTVQMRPVLMTCIVACVGLLLGPPCRPASLPGAEAARRCRSRRDFADAGADPADLADADRSSHVHAAAGGRRGRRGRKAPIWRSGNPRAPPAAPSSSASPRLLLSGCAVALAFSVPRRRRPIVTPRRCCRRRPAPAAAEDGAAQHFAAGQRHPGRLVDRVSAPRRSDALTGEALAANPNPDRRRGRHCARRTS